MSPRAAWRLERLGFEQVFDFSVGKAAWLAMGWPREGTAVAVPNAGEVARSGTPTCWLDDRIRGVREGILAAGADACIVVNPEGIVQGRLMLAALSEDPEVTAEEAMEIRPTTVRPSEALKPLVERMRKKSVRTMIVTDLRGKLLGLLYREDAERALANPAEGKPSRPL